MAETTVGSYIFERLKQLGVKTVFGVPGDYELVLLDLVLEAGLVWRGNPNELNAGYAADGYARVNGIGAVVTTFGPGELSNMCPIAGCYAEFVPVVHIVGYPTEAAQKGNNIMHHSLGEVGDGKFDVFHKMSELITCATTVLHDSSIAAKEVDRVLNAMLLYSKPVYIGIPTEISTKKISGASLKTPLQTSLPPNDMTLETKVVAGIRKRIDDSNSPVIIVDGGAARHSVLEESEELIKATGFPYFVTAMGKGSVAEHYLSYGGVYSGAGSIPPVRKAIETSDLVLWIGNYPSDFNTGEFTENVSKSVIVEFQRFYVMLGEDRHDVKMKYVLQALIKDLKRKPLSYSAMRSVPWDPYPFDKSERKEVLTQDFLWASLGKYFRDGDFVISETGTSSFGIPASSLIHVRNVKMFNQTVFGSIGYATGAAVGAFVAGKESGSIKRPILVTGEGSLQLTVQAFSDLLRHEVNPTIFLLNNDGYTIERLIHGMEAPYNKIPTWDYRALFKAFGPAYNPKYYLVKTSNELEELLNNASFNKADRPQLVELILNKHDAPMSVKMSSKAVEEFNRSK